MGVRGGSRGGSRGGARGGSRGGSMGGFRGVSRGWGQGSEGGPPYHDQVRCARGQGDLRIHGYGCRGSGYTGVQGWIAS